MVPTILLRAKYNPSSAGKLQRLSRKRWQRIIVFFPAVPKFVGLHGFRIRQPNGPGLRAAGDQRQMTLRAGSAKKYQLLAIGRPAGSKIAVHAGSNVADLFHRRVRPKMKIKNGNKTVVLAHGAE